jgi:exosortase
VDPQYNYGWAVPLCVAFIAWEKWKTFKPQTGGDRRALGSAVLCLFLLGPIWLVHEAAPDWSVVNWSFGFVVCGYLFSLLIYNWGTVSIRPFLFPILFILCAIPWPQRFELAMVQDLMKGVAAAAAEIMAWLDIPARATGNIIRLQIGAVGVDEACSGVRSMQAMLMTSLFLGELKRLHLAGRISLVLIGALFALLFNLVRTTVLVWIAATRGFGEFGKWHDPAGFSILCLTFLCLWGVSHFFPSKHLVSVSDGKPSFGMAAPWPVIFLLTAWILFFVGGTELWYRQRENRSSRSLTVAWPKDAVDLTDVPISDNARRILLYDNAQCAVWTGDKGIRWLFFFLVWNSGRTSTQSARIHRPENCLAGSGAVLRSELGETVVRIANIPMRFRSYIFDLGGNALYVYYMVWEESNRDLDPGLAIQDYSGIGRLQRVLLAQRNLGQQSIEVVLSGAIDENAASAVLKEKLREILAVHES